MRQRIHTTADPHATLWRTTDPNYPDSPTAPDVVARSTSRSTVEYKEYVNAYAAQQRGHILLFSAGIVITIGAAYYLPPPWLIIAAAAGIGMTLAGAVGFGVARDAHRSYTRYLAISVSETYERPTPAPQPQTVRPFVASSNGDARTTNTGRLDFTPAVWRDLFDRALDRGGVITRDEVARPAGVGRRWYHGEGWGEFLAELSRLGFIDGRNRLTPAALAWYEQQIPLPLTSIPVRSRNERTNGERTANERPEWGEWGGGDDE